MFSKKPKTWIVTAGTAAGVPWQINGKVTEATEPKQALIEILSQARKFPVVVEVHSPTGVRRLLMDENGRTTPYNNTNSDSGQDPAEDHTTTQPSIALVDTAQQSETLDETAPVAPHAGQELIEQGTRDRGFRLAPAWLLIPALVVVAAGGAVVLMGHHGSTAEEPATATSSSASGWVLGDGQEPVAVLGSMVLSLQGQTLRVFDAATGTQLGQEITTTTPEKVRTFNASTPAVDTGDGRVWLFKDTQHPTEVTGTLNARGTQPIITKGATYTTSAGQTGTTGKNRVVFDADHSGPVFFEAPNKVITGKHTTNLAAPQKAATITHLIQATQDQVIVLWKKDKTTWLTIHDPKTGAIRAKHPVNPKDVVLRNGITWIGADTYLDGTEMKKVCAGGGQVNTVMMCPTDRGWESTDHLIRTETKPEAISADYAVTDRHVYPLKENS